MQKRHLDRKMYFEEQSITTRNYVIPYISQHLRLKRGMRVLEIGCGEGGNMPPFLEIGCTVVGIDILESKIGKASRFIADHPQRHQLTLQVQDIYDVDPSTYEPFDLIVMRDVIEHIPNQDRFMAFLKPFLKEDGLIFFGFPPWYMPFGGHQQVCKNKLLAVMPWYHLLPVSLYCRILRAGGESDNKIKNLLANKRTGISIERFEGILRQLDFSIKNRTLFLFNPNYKVKYNLPPTRQVPILDAIPFARNFYTTCVYYLVEKASL